MMLPNAERAVVDIRKLRDYCRNPDHDEGKNKARLFAAALAMATKDAEYLRKALLVAVKENDAQLGRRDEFGQRYTVDFFLEWRGKQTTIRSGWIIKKGTNYPSLTTCFLR